MASDQEERPPLPPTIAANAEWVEVYDSCFTGEAAQRREAALALLKALPEAKPDAHFKFLLLTAGSGDFPIGLGAAFARLSDSYPACLSETREMVMTLTSLDDVSFFRGILLAAGHLELAEPAVVEALGRRLNQPKVSAAAREALRLLTRREFESWESFGAWWSTHQSLPRSAWLIEAADAALDRELELWQLRLSSNPADALVALAAPRMAVRRLGYDALRSYPAPAGLPIDSPVAQALLLAFQNERTPELRESLLALIPRFLGGGDAVSLLEQALTGGSSSEQLHAARALQLIQPVDIAQQALVRALARLYLDSDHPSGSTEFRLTLFGVLKATGGKQKEPDAELSALLLNALSFESDLRVRAQVYATVGALGGTAFVDVLLPHLDPLEHPVSDRRASLDALVRIALETEQADGLLRVLPPMLADPSPEVRYAAVLGVRRLASPAALALIPPRLAFEAETALLGEMLKVLGMASAPNSLDALLSLQPRSEHFELWTLALRTQIGSEMASLETALNSLESTASWRAASLLVESFPKEGLSEEALQVLAQHHARSLTQWLLEGSIENGRIALAEDAAGRLRELAALYPTQSEWLVLLGSIEFARGQPAAAFEALGLALSLGLPEMERWRVVEKALQAAIQSENREEGLLFYKGLGEIPADYKEQLSAYQQQLEALSPSGS